VRRFFCLRAFSLRAFRLLQWDCVGSGKARKRRMGCDLSADLLLAVTFLVATWPLSCARVRPVNVARRSVDFLFALASVAFMFSAFANFLQWLKTLFVLYAKPLGDVFGNRFQTIILNSTNANSGNTRPVSQWP